MERLKRMTWIEVSIYIFIIMLLITMIALWIYFEIFKYKHTVIIRELANNRKFIIKDKACIITDQNKTMWWKLKKEKDKIKKLMPLPPPEAIELTKNGKKWVETYRTDNGEYIFIQDTAKIDDVPDDVLEILDTVPPEILAIKSEEIRKIQIEKRKGELLKKWREENNIIKPLKPFSTNQRIALINGIKKAEIRKNSDWKKDIPVYMALGGVILIVICAFIFAPDVIETWGESSEQISNSVTAYEDIRHKNLIEEQKNWDKISQGIQIIYNVQLEQDKKLKELENGKQ